MGQENPKSLSKTKKKMLTIIFASGVFTIRIGVKKIAATGCVFIPAKGLSTRHVSPPAVFLAA
jgi:hypothetical protein